MRHHPSRHPSSTSNQKRDALVEQHVEWARDVAAKVAAKLPTWWTADDLVGPAFLALLEACTRFESERGIPFRAYAIRRVEGACYSAARRNAYRERAHAELPAELPGMAAEPREAQLFDRLAELPILEERVMRLCYQDDLTLAEAAERMAISPAQASQLRRAALKKLKERLSA